MVDSDMICARALALIAENGRDVASRLGSQLGISRQVASKHLKTLVAKGAIEAEGNTRGRAYRLAAIRSAFVTFDRAGLQEDIVWREVFRDVVRDLPESVRTIWNHGVSEMVNNAVDHSGSPVVHVGIRRTALYTDGWISDEGVGIFLKIQKAFDLYDPREALLELAKGKLTTDPERHTGEGVFFTSRMFDLFVIESAGLHFMHDDRSLDLLLEHPVVAPGTRVFMRLANDSTRTSAAVFDEFAAAEDYSFSKTVVPVRLAQYEGEKLVSRSQAKRLSRRFERFRNVVLDFSGVVEIGQAFADELFRVFAKEHPGVQLTPVNMTKAVARMLARVGGTVATPP